MSKHDDDVQSFIRKKLHSLLFLEEFVFSRNKFSPPSSSELEFADAVVMLGDVLLIYQIKERSIEENQNEDTERNWFKSKVIKKATKQIRDTIHFLQTYSEIRVPNERGHEFNLASCKYTDIIKIVIYSPSSHLPDDCQGVRHYVSESAGFIHIIDASDYLELSRTLRVPDEVVRYFKYREVVLTRFFEPCAGLPEPAIAGHFIGGDSDFSPTAESVVYLHNLIQDAEEWDLTSFMRGLRDHLSVPGLSDNYYDILIEFAKLPRSMWREVKQRIRRSIENVQENKSTIPYRITVPHTGCGFVFIPISREISSKSNWENTRLLVIQNFTRAHKYDQHLSKCIGVMIAKDESYFDILWCLISHDWVEDVEIQQALDQCFPFRPVKSAEVNGYRFAEG
jgi:hypothetical protein